MPTAQVRPRAPGGISTGAQPAPIGGRPSRSRSGAFFLFVDDPETVAHALLEEVRPRLLDAFQSHRPGDQEAEDALRHMQEAVVSVLAAHTAPPETWIHLAEPVLLCLAEAETNAMSRGVTEAMARALEASSAHDAGKAALRFAFLARAVNALSGIVQDLDEEALSRATGAPSDRAVLLHALEHPSAISVLEEEDPLAEARLRGLRARDQILSAEGGTLLAGRVADHLRISRQAVDKRRQAGKLIGLDVGRHGYAYPSWQFDERGVLPGLEDVLGNMRIRDPWMQAGFFLSGDPRLQGATPLERLRHGDVEAVVRAARGYGQHGGA